jgi:hypothetical protein
MDLARNIQNFNRLDKQGDLWISKVPTYDIWIVYLGSLCKSEGWQGIIHRKNRCDLSLFQLGLRLLEHFLNEGLAIPVQFHVII